MSGIVLSKKDLLHKDLIIEEIILIKIVYQKEEELFKALHKDIKEPLLKHLQDKGYIKLLTDKVESVEDVTLRALADEVVKEDNDSVAEIINYLNSKVAIGNSKKGFSPKSSAHRRFISGRLAEGYTKEELKKVIDHKVNEWKNTNFDMYLRPETLFQATKFAGYLIASERNTIQNKASINDIV